ncbi:restriction endonuclease [Hyphomonas sp.]|uniref:restriction endonuclease n=1 Tax=Hyphomonas sp. TaxID=87 RepID=UPI000C5DE468|nr:restriction endonuclease [Hyphomonas sp.]MAB09944.1 restriction endonuclease [Hyphomonas sp.]MAU66696.1 restriction endonuclease [Hyphomonas sp.]MBM57656.1 restriction endonuclease [Hyphomonas sp.]
MSKVWLVRLGEYGEAEADALATGELATGWDLPAFEQAMPRDAILKLLEEAFPEQKPGTLQNWAVQLNQFCNKAAAGDLTVTPLKTASRQLAIGRIEGDFFSAKGKHPARRVKWLITDLPRDALKQDLLYSLGASQTICQISRNNAAVRFEEIVRTRKDPGDSHLPTSIKNDDEEDLEDGNDQPIDLAEIARDQIERHISSTFVGHAFTRLISAILQAEGFQTQVSPPGSDKGIDILAGKSTLGFDSPRLVVQVKSGDIVADQPTLQGLIGCIADTQSDHGLLVSWSGFTTPVRQRANELYFRVRLWGREEILNALFSVYDRLPEQIRADLPLQRIWAVLPQEDLG